MAEEEMRRQPDKEWCPPNTWAYVNLQVLMDIRDELKRLNGLLHCSNFTAIPHTLAAIKRNTTKKKRVRKCPAHPQTCRNP